MNYSEAVYTEPHWDQCLWSE